MSRRPPEDRGAVITWHKQGLTPAEIRHKTGFDRHFVKRWIANYNDSGSLDDAKRAGRPRKVSKSVERTVERKMRGKRRRSSRVIARELKRQKVCDVSYTTVQRTVHRRGLHAFHTTENLATVSSSQARPIAVRQDQHQEGLESRGV